ncbi:unnamed protein product [Fraxinus pennsylvanica]|uniref:Uncharacterized protein n=1 Tax=Fraxinus pennsylvanica TaxID=56036 RepID=A0AAD2DJG5_9LAMI|nr:unnamed protein product [Fraxinus pennsylvanica]
MLYLPFPIETKSLRGSAFLVWPKNGVALTTAVELAVATIDAISSSSLQLILLCNMLLWNFGEVVCVLEVKETKSSRGSAFLVWPKNGVALTTAVELAVATIDAISCSSLQLILLCNMLLWNFGEVVCVLEVKGEFTLRKRKS